LITGYPAVVITGITGICVNFSTCMEYRVVCSLCKGHDVSVLYDKKCCLVVIRHKCKKSASWYIIDSAININSLCNIHKNWSRKKVFWSLSGPSPLC